MSQAYQCDLCKEYHPGQSSLRGDTGVTDTVQVSLWTHGVGPFMRISLTLTRWDAQGSTPHDLCLDCCNRLLRAGLVKMGWRLELPDGENHKPDE